MSDKDLYKNIKKLHNESMEDVGKKVVLSAAVFETGIAALLYSESRKIQAILDRCHKNS